MSTATRMHASMSNSVPAHDALHRALILDFEQIAALGAAALPWVGGKGMNLGALCGAGLRVPPGFCVTTRAFHAFIAGDPEYDRLIDAVDAVAPADLETVRDRAAALRAHLTQKDMPAAIREAILAAWRAQGADASYAVRSSATAEDLPGASFAGQQDTYLEVRGAEAILDRVRACWASLYTDRAILYRMQNRIAHRDVALSVVVQRMVRADKSGILFTADPVSGNRHVLAIDAGFGLGEALVSGLVSADLYKVDKRSRALLVATIGQKALAIRPAADGGTYTEELPPEIANAQVLEQDEIHALTDLGLAIEALQGCPQDVEWCIEEQTLYVVQARPITSLYPLPSPAPDDDFAHAYVCLNHFQVMTDAMSPMGISVWQHFMPFGRSEDEPRPSPWLYDLGGRMFLDASEILRNPATRKLMMNALGGVDRITQATVAELALRPELLRGPRVHTTALLRFALPRVADMLPWLLWRDPAGMTERVSEELDRLEAGMRARILGPNTPRERVCAAREVLLDLFPRMMHLPPLVLCGLAAGRLAARLAGASAEEQSAIGRGLSGNVTTDMDLAVGDLADAARGVPALVAWLQSDAPEQDALAALAEVPGAERFQAALAAFLERYGMRGPAEIDLARPRWRDDVRSILKVVAGNLAIGQEGAHRAHHARLAREAEEVAATLAARARRGVLGWLRSRLVRRLIRVHRELGALREHPKFLLVRVIDCVRRAALDAGARLREQGGLDATEDVFWLRLDEAVAALDGMAQEGRDARARCASELRARIASRKAEHERCRHMSPPRVLLDSGEMPVAHPDRGAIPDHALAGSPASAGEVVGIARVIRDPTREVLHKGEILVAPFTDPGWTPLFLNAAGLVMEVGGLMTHGSVVAREYGIPAVVCVANATARIRTGQRIRVQGDLGYVEILDDRPDGPDDAA